jgi:hypothetical protein
MARPEKTVHTSDEARKAAEDTARHLLNIGAVNFKPEDPYTFTSGRVSPSYIDCRRVIAFPEAREAMTAHAVALIDREIGRDNIDVIAGGETAGIPYAAFVAVALGKPMVYVRKQPKGFGRMAQIEGALDDDARVLLVELHRCVARSWRHGGAHLCCVPLRHLCRSLGDHGQARCRPPRPGNLVGCARRRPRRQRIQHRTTRQC